MRPRCVRGLGSVVLVLAGVAGACTTDDALTTTGVDAGPGVPAPVTPPRTTSPGADVPDADAPETSSAPPDAGPDVKVSDPSIGDPDPFDPAAYDTEADIDTTDPAQRRAISPLIYGLNSYDVSMIPAAVLKSITFVRRGGDRVNTYDWETNLSANSTEQDDETATNDYDYLPSTIKGADVTKPAAFDLDMIARTRAAGISAMVPFTLNDYVSKVAGDAHWVGWSLATAARTTLFDRVHPVSSSPFLAEPDTTDGAVYADEHFHYLKAKLGDIYAPGPTRVLVGTDNEPDIYHVNYPFLQAGNGKNLISKTGKVVGKLVDGDQFTDEKFLPFARRVKALDPNAFVVGPDHYHYDGITTWDQTMSAYSDRGDGAWVMDDFLDKVRAASEAAGHRLLDVWDFHWYPQSTVSGTYVEYLTGKESPAALAGVLGTPRELWDDTYRTNAWYADADHTNGPTYILTRVKDHLAAHYPGTPVGVSEYWPGGCGTIFNGLGVADILGIFQRMDVALGAMWPDCGDVRYAYGAFRLLRNADGDGRKFASVYAPVTNPATATKEKAERALSSVYAGSDDRTTMTVLVINKTAAARRFALRAKHSSLLRTVTAYRIEEGQPIPVAHPADTLAKKNAYLYAAPAYSASLLVFQN